MSAALAVQPALPVVTSTAQAAALLHVLSLAAEQAWAMGLAATAERLGSLRYQAAAELSDMTGDMTPLRLAVGA